MSVYGTGTVHISLEVFLGTSLARIEFDCSHSSVDNLKVIGVDLPAPFLAANDAHNQNSALTYETRHSITEYSGAGILTSCPSTTPFGLALGPD